MRTLWQAFASLLFVIQIFVMMPLMGIVFLPWAAFSRNGAIAGIHTWCAWTRASARIMLGLRSEIRGRVPEGAVLVAAKHQSFFDVILLSSALPRPRFIMKRELTRTPVLGWFALRIGCVPVDRGRRGAAVTKMLKDVAEGRDDPGQLIIYPQGTRTPPGEHLPYKPGVAALYRQAGQVCVPVATNVGLFWPKAGLIRKPGLAVLEFLDPIEPGVEAHAFLEELERRVETASDRLMAEAGFTPEGKAA